jgi:hypothetical protein
MLDEQLRFRRYHSVEQVITEVLQVLSKMHLVEVRGAAERLPVVLGAASPTGWKVACEDVFFELFVCTRAISTP